jgi:hypothetical protein
MAAPIRLHIDALGRLHRVWGAFGVLTGTALMVLAAGTGVALLNVSEPSAAARGTIWLLLICGAVLAAAGVAMAAAGRALDGRQPRARQAVLILTLPNLVVVPFGTALAIYAAWVLLNDEARHQFGRAPRSSARLGAMDARDAFDARDRE